MKSREAFAVVLNPSAGRGKARFAEHAVVRALNRLKVSFTLEKTVEPQHATRIAKEAARDYDTIIAVGGDGTVHEVVNGIVGTSSSLAIVPVGSGNDFGRHVKAPGTVDKAVEAIVNGIRRRFDVGSLTVRRSGADPEQRSHFINTLGIGLDAAVAHQSQRIRWLRGVPLYMLAALKALTRFKAQEYVVRYDSHEAKASSYLVCVGNCECEGGGFRLTPNANPYDGRFEICMVKSMPVLRALQLLPKALRGLHGGQKEVELMEARSISIRSNTPFIAHADGEIVGSDVTGIEIGVLPGAVNVIVPAHG